MDEPRRILVINGHPGPEPGHLCDQLADAYEQGARNAGHRVERLDIGRMSFPIVRSLDDYATSPIPPDVERAQAMVKGADHIALVFPIWFGGPPAYLKGFFEQLLRHGFSLSRPQAAMSSLLSGRSVRLIVTMGAPVAVYRLALGAHGVRSLSRGLLWMTGAGPIRQTLLGRAHRPDGARIAAWKLRAKTLGWRGV